MKIKNNKNVRESRVLCTLCNISFNYVCNLLLKSNQYNIITIFLILFNNNNRVYSRYNVKLCDTTQNK